MVLRGGGGSKCSGSEAGSYLRLVDFVYHSTLGLRVIKTRRKHAIATTGLKSGPAFAHLEKLFPLEGKWVNRVTVTERNRGESVSTRIDGWISHFQVKVVQIN